MTVLDRTPIERYTGTGSLTHFGYHWDVLPESITEVRVDNMVATDYVDENKTIIFNTAPVNGAEVLIFRRTPIQQPEDYEFARGFKANKTELTLDRGYMIAGEYQAGVVGATDIYSEPLPDVVVVHSERGTDAIIGMWADIGARPPIDESILWFGTELVASRSVSSDNSFVNMRFGNTSGGGPINQSNASYIVPTGTDYAGWVDHETPDLGAYWIRVRNGGDTSIPNGLLFTIKDRFGTVKNYNDEFEPVNATLEISITAAVPPLLGWVTLLVDICKDDNGSPDGSWGTRAVYMELEYTT